MKSSEEDGELRGLRRDRPNARATNPRPSIVSLRLIIHMGIEAAQPLHLGSVSAELVHR